METGLDRLKKKLDALPSEVVINVVKQINIKELKEKLDEENEKELSRRFIP